MRLLTAVYLRVAEGVREEEVVLQTIVIVIDHVCTEIAPWMLHGTEGLAQVVQGDDIGCQDVGATPQLPPALLIPDLAVATFFLQILVRLRQQPGQAAAMPRRGGEKRHLVTIRLRVLEVINTGKLMHHAGEGRMGRDILDLLAVQPYFTAIFETLDVARTCHGAQRCSGIERHALCTFTVVPGVAWLYRPS